MKIIRPESATPQNVAKLATESARLPRRVLLGVFGPANAPAALVRTNRGDVETVGVGDKIDGDTVAAIGPDSIVISRRGRNEVLRLPSG